MAIDASQLIDATARIAQWPRIWVVTHLRPDGDALGALVGARAILRSPQVGCRSVRAFSFDPLPPRYAPLLADDPPEVWDAAAAPPVDEIDGFVVVDTSARRQLEPFIDAVERSGRPIAVFDHHLTSDLRAAPKLVDASYSSACLLMAEWAEALGADLDPFARRAIFMGMATDTGWFRFPSVDERTMRVAGRLIAQGVEPADLYERLYCADSPGRLRLIGRLLSGMELHADGRLALACVTRAMIAESGIRPGEMEELSADLGRIGSVIAHVVLTEQEAGQIRINFRSKHTIDVAALAASLGGGGHARAAGLRLRLPLEQARAMVLNRLLAEPALRTSPA